MKIAALTSGRNVPSSRFRVRQYIDLFAARGHRVVEYCPLVGKYAGPKSAPHLVYRAINAAKVASRIPGVIGSRRADATWLEREMVSRNFTLERYLGSPLVFDVDDAIWAGSDRAASAVARIAERADVVLAGNSYIADWFSGRARDVRIVPTALDAARFIPGPPAGLRRFRLVWTGLATNLVYVYAIERALSDFLAARDAEIVIVADERPQFTQIPHDRVVFVRWSPENEAEALKIADVGLMPLPDDEWTRGKCSLKMIQYMATGLPSVVSPVGMNRDILAMAHVGFGAATDDEWRSALDGLWSDETLRRRMGTEGRKSR